MFQENFNQKRTQNGNFGWSDQLVEESRPDRFSSLLQNIHICFGIVGVCSVFQNIFIENNSNWQNLIRMQVKGGRTSGTSLFLKSTY